MPKRELFDLLAMSESLLDGNALDQVACEQISEAERREILSLAELAQQVKDALAPVRPSASFRQRLEQDLIDVVRQRMHEKVYIAPLSPRRDVLIGAAIGSAVALAGGVVYLVHNWMRSRSERIERVNT